MNNKYTLPRLQHIVESTSTAGLPNQVDPAAVETVAQECLSIWPPKVNELLKRIYAAVQAVFVKVFKEVFAHYDKSPISESMDRILMQFLETAKSQYQEYIGQMGYLETTQVSPSSFHCRVFIMSDKSRSEPSTTSIISGTVRQTLRSWRVAARGISRTSEKRLKETRLSPFLRRSALAAVSLRLPR